MVAVRTHILLPAELLEKIDDIAGARGRSKYVVDALEERVRRDRLREAVTHIRDADPPDAPAPAWEGMDSVEWVRQQRGHPPEVLSFSTEGVDK